MSLSFQVSSFSTDHTKSLTGPQHRLTTSTPPLIGSWNWFHRRLHLSLLKLTCRIPRHVWLFEDWEKRKDKNCWNHWLVQLSIRSSRYFRSSQVQSVRRRHITSAVHSVFSSSPKPANRSHSGLLSEGHYPPSTHDATQRDANSTA